MLALYQPHSASVSQLVSECRQQGSYRYTQVLHNFRYRLPFCIQSLIFTAFWHIEVCYTVIYGFTIAQGSHSAPYCRIACVAGLHPSGIEPGTIPYPCLQKASEIVKIFKTFQSFQTTFHYLLINYVTLKNY